MAKPYKMTIDAGADFEIGISVRLADETTPEPLDGYSARAQIRHKHSDALVGKFDCDIANPALGEISVKMPNRETSKILPSDLKNQYYWDLEIYTPSDARVRRLVGGVVEVTREATK